MRQARIAPSPDEIVHAVAEWLDERGGWLSQRIGGVHATDEELAELCDGLLKVASGLRSTANSIAAERRSVQRCFPALQIIQGGRP